MADAGSPISLGEGAIVDVETAAYGGETRLRQRVHVPVEIENFNIVPVSATVLIVAAGREIIAGLANFRNALVGVDVGMSNSGASATARILCAVRTGGVGGTILSRHWVTQIDAATPHPTLSIWRAWAPPGRAFAISDVGASLHLTADADMGATGTSINGTFYVRRLAA